MKRNNSVLDGSVMHQVLGHVSCSIVAVDYQFKKHDIDLWVCTKHFVKVICHSVWESVDYSVEAGLLSYYYSYPRADAMDHIYAVCEVYLWRWPWDATYVDSHRLKGGKENKKVCLGPKLVCFFLRNHLSAIKMAKGRKAELCDVPATAQCQGSPWTMTLIPYHVYPTDHKNSSVWQNVKLKF